MTINARALEHAICKMLSHPLEEVQRIGLEIKKVSRENVPTLVKYAEQDECLLQFQKDFSTCRDNVSQEIESVQDWVQVVHTDDGGEERILAALLVRFGEMSFQQALTVVQDLSNPEKIDMAERFLGRLGEHDIPLRELEYASITVDMVLDQGAYFELKRHRMMTQTPQRFTTRLGYAVPRLISDAGLLPDYTAVMNEVKTAYEKLATAQPEAAAYILPNAFNRRVLLQMNLRSALHFIRLRSAPNAHFSIRRAAQRLAQEIQKSYPLFAKYFTPDNQETWETISEDYFINCF